jgi:DNA-binding transcriptional regulator YdaS (Cro superfamily)
MKLKAYFEGKDGKVRRDGPELVRVAAAAGCSPYTLYMIALEHKRASATLAKAIEEGTDRRVRRQELRPDIFGSNAPGTKAA